MDIDGKVLGFSRLSRLPRLFSAFLILASDSRVWWKAAPALGFRVFCKFGRENPIGDTKSNPNIDYEKQCKFSRLLASRVFSELRQAAQR